MQANDFYFDLQLVAFDWDPELESLDYKMFSPLHSQVQSELGSSYNPFQSSSSVFSGNPNNSFQIQTQYSKDEVDTCISEFLDSILGNSEELPDKEKYVLQSGFDGGVPDQVRGLSSTFNTICIYIKKNRNHI